MAIIKQSFLSNVIGASIYRELKRFSKLVVTVGALILVVLFGLTLICHYTFVSSLFDITTGTSLFFIVFIVELILLLDLEVEVEVSDTKSLDSHKKNAKPKKYKLTIIWGMILFILGITAIYFSNKYKKQYRFECETFLVDENAGIYHLNEEFNDCEALKKAEDFVAIKGYRMPKSYKFCEDCEQWQKDVEDEDMYDSL